MDTLVIIHERINGMLLLKLYILEKVHSKVPGYTQ